MAHYSIRDKSLYRRYNRKWKYLLLLKLECTVYVRVARRYQERPIKNFLNLFAIWRIIFNANNLNFSKVGKLRAQAAHTVLFPDLKDLLKWRDETLILKLKVPIVDIEIKLSGISKRKVPCSDYRNKLESKSLTIFNGWKRDYKVRVHWF